MTQPQEARFVEMRLGDEHHAEYDRNDGTLRLSWAGHQTFLDRQAAANLLELLYQIRDELNAPHGDDEGEDDTPSTHDEASYEWRMNVSPQDLQDGIDPRDYYHPGEQVKRVNYPYAIPEYPCEPQETNWYEC